MLELTGPVIVTLELNARKKDDKKNDEKAEKDKNSDFLSGDALSVEDWEKIIEKLKPYVHEYRVAGYEPTLSPYFFDILKFLEKTEKFYHIFTGGLWENTDEILEKLMEFSHVNTILFPLHGHKDGIHGAFTGQGGEEDFERLLDNIRLTYSSGYSVNTNTVLNKHNIDYIEDIATLSQELGAKYAIFSRYIGGNKDLEISAHQFQKACQQVDELKSQGFNVMMGNCVPQCLYSSPSSGCFAGITYGVVDWRGNLKPCEYSWVTGGNLLEKPVKALWQSSSMKKWRGRIDKACKKCIKLSVCPSGCKALAEILQTERDPFIMGTICKPVEPPLMEVTLDENLCPLPRYMVRAEDFGWILIHGTQVIPVSLRAEKVLQAINGRTTLGEIKKKFGGAPLSFIYSLYVRDFVEFRTKEEEETKIGGKQP